MVEIKVTQNQVRVGEKTKNSLRRDGAVRRAVSAKEVHRSDPEGVVGGSKKALRGKNINRKHVRGLVKNGRAGQVLIQSARNINSHPSAARWGWGEGHEAWECWED